MTIEQETGRKHILLVTTADTDILTAERAMSGMAAEGFPQVRAYIPLPWKLRIATESFWKPPPVPESWFCGY